MSSLKVADRCKSLYIRFNHLFANANSDMNAITLLFDSQKKYNDRGCPQHAIGVISSKTG